MLVTLQADFGLLDGIESLEADDRIGIATTRRHMTTGRTMARLARLPLMNAAMDVVAECLRVRLVTIHAQLVVVHKLGLFDLWKRHLERRELHVGLVTWASLLGQEWLSGPLAAFRRGTRTATCGEQHAGER